MKYFVGLLVLFAALPAFPKSAAQPKQTGWLDVADCSGISGWAWNAAQPSARVEVSLYDGSVQGSPLATTTAENYRLDLRQAGIDDGFHGFYLPTPASLKDGRTHSIVAVAAGVDAPIQLGANTLSCPAEATGYRYYVLDNLTAASPDNWSTKGDATYAAGGVTAASATGAALLSRLPVPDGSSEYEVKAALYLKESGGVYTIYLHASSDALASPAAASGSYYAVELQNPVFTEKGCTATLSISKRSSETVTDLRSEPVACHDGMELRAVSATDGRIGVWLDHWKLTMLEDSEVASGQPGVGVRGAPAANSLSAVGLGQLDRLAPGPLFAADVQVSASANRVELSWPRITDDPNGIGMGIYIVSRDGKVVANLLRVQSTYLDTNVTPGAVYTYEIAAYDMHLNRTSTFLTVATPEANKLARK